MKILPAQSRQAFIREWASSCAMDAGRSGVEWPRREAKGLAAGRNVRRQVIRRGTGHNNGMDGHAAILFGTGTRTYRKRQQANKIRRNISGRSSGLTWVMFSPLRLLLCRRTL